MIVLRGAYVWVLSSFLASLVTLSHFGLNNQYIGPGCYAVVCFYMLSGLLMCRQYNKFNKLAARPILSFYIDRILRVFPVYWVVCIIGVLLFGSSDYIQNFLLIPLSYQDFTNAKPLVFPAWSLATEFHFYFLVPFLVFLPSRILRIFMWVSFAIFSISPFLPHSTWWGYYGMPGTIFIFIAGILLARLEEIRSLLFASIVVLCVFAVGKVLKLDIPSGINISVCLGIVFAYFSVQFFDRFQPTRWDTFAGALTLPLFLSHPIVMSYWESKNMLLLFFVALLFSFILTVLVEKPMDIIRYRIRAWLFVK